MYDLEAYPFWKMKSHHRLVVRFIPDLNEHNDFGFLDEFHFHRVEVDGKSKMALCSAIHEDKQTCYHCIIAKRAFNKINKLGDDARRHWRKQQYVGNVIIIEDPLEITDPENPKTYKLPVGKQLFNSLQGELLSTKIKAMPSDYHNGNNFVISREMHAGIYPKYTGVFQRKSKLSTAQIELAEESVIDLSELRPTLYSSSCQDGLSKDLMWEILGNE